ncbi:MAG: phage portal protein [Lachnospiraceae bacterium]|nr:phage portal protein [Lachnospiraceae bacterium]
MSIREWLGIGSPRDAPKKALPEITDNVRDSGGVFVFGMSNAGENVDERSALQIATVYACVRLLAESVASLPLHLYRFTESGSGKERATDHPLYKLLYRQTNPDMTSFSWREAAMMHLLLWGNSYSQIIRDGKNGILGLYPLLPENVEVDRNDAGEIYYIYHAYTDETPGENNRDIYFKREEILHIPGLGFNGLVGFSPIAMMKNTLGTTLAVEKYGSSFFRNGAQPSGVLEHPGVLKDPQKIRDNWAAVYGGANNAHKVAVLEENMHYKPISLPPEDSQFLSTREFGVEEICRIFRVPPHMVQDLKRATFSNIEHQSIDFVQHTLMPWLTRIEQAIIKDVLVGEEQDEYFPKFNVDGLLRGDYQSRMNGYAVGFSNGFLSPNDIRRLENMDLIPAEEGGDDYYLNGSYVKLRDAGIGYGQNAEAMREKKEAGKPDEDSKGDERPSSDDAPEHSDESDSVATEPSKDNDHAKRHKQRRDSRRGKDPGKDSR